MNSFPDLNLKNLISKMMNKNLNLPCIGKLLLYTSLTTSLLFSVQPVSAQVNYNDVSAEEPSETIFVGPMSKQANPPDPSTHPLLGPGWTYNSTFSDEFDIGPLNTTTKWQKTYIWGNTHENHLNYNRTDAANHIMYTDPLGNKCLRLVTRRENFTAAVYSYKPNDELLIDGRKNYRTFEYTTGMINSLQPINTLYGFIEIRCKIPKARYQIADFWLYNSSGDPTGKFINEIDVFETDNGTDWNLTTHTNEGGEVNPFYHHHKFIKAVDNSSFCDDYNTYAIKWEPNKLIYYLNNKVVRVVRDHIANHRLNILATLELESGLKGQNGRGQVSDALAPGAENYYDIDYIRVYHRVDYSKPIPLYTLNDVKAPSVDYPVNVKFGLPIILNAVESFSTDNNYTLSVQRCNDGGGLLGVEAKKTLTVPEKANLERIDIKNFCQSNGLTLVNNAWYKVKLSSGNTSPIIENVQYFLTSTCTNNVQFLINGQNMVSPQPCVVSYDAGFPKILMDASKSQHCDGQYFVSIENSDVNATRQGGEVMGWLTSSEIASIGKLDLFSFASSRGLTLQYGKYYLVKLASGSPSVSLTKLLYIKPAINIIDISINSNPGDAYGNVKLSYTNYQPPVFLEGYKCKTSYNIPKPYLLSMRLSNSVYGDVGPEITDWFSSAEIAHKDLRAWATSKGLAIEYGKFYKVQVATNYPFTQKALLLELSACTNKSDFDIEGQHRTDMTAVNIPLNGPVRLNAWTSVSCNPSRYYFLGVQQCDASGYTGIGAGVPPLPNQDWLSDDATDYMGNPYIDNLGSYDIRKFAASYGLTLSAGNYYRISLCTGGNFDCHFAVIYMKLTHRPTGIEEEHVNEITLYPNPANESLSLDAPGRQKELSVKVFDLQGRIVQEHRMNVGENSMNVSELHPGMYILEIINGDKVYRERVQIVH
jgi:beta-glucanase (GH16 family)